MRRRAALAGCVRVCAEAESQKVQGLEEMLLNIQTHGMLNV